MKKLSILLFICIILVSCKDESVDFGTVEYYPAFLWEDANISPVTKTMDCDFSLDAQNDANSFAEFQFVDNEGKAVPTSEMQVKVDGIVAKKNIFRVYSKTKSVKLEFTFSPDAKTGKHQGYLKLINHELDRLDSHQLSSGQKIDVFQWTLNYDKGINPLAFILLCIGVVILSCLSLWFLFIQRLVYPVIKLSRIEVKETSENKRINRCRKVVFCNKKSKQSVLSKIFTGKILYVSNSIWTSDWELKPGKEKRTVKPMLHGNYTMSPMKVYLKSMDEFSLTNIQNKSVIHLKLT